MPISTGSGEEEPVNSLISSGFSQLLTRDIVPPPTPNLKHGFIDNPGGLIMSDQGMGGSISLGTQFVTVPVGSNIQKAIDSVSAAGGGIVRLLAAKYEVDYNIQIPVAVTLQGDGQGTDNGGTIIDFNSENFNISVLGTSLVPVSNFGLKDVTVQESGASAAVDIKYANRFEMSNVRASNNTNIGILMTAVQQYKMSNCLSDNNGSHAFRLEGASGFQHNSFKYSNCRATNNGGIGFSQSSNASNVVLLGKFSGCVSLSNTGDGFDFNNGGLEADLSFVGCVANGNSGKGFDINTAFTMVSFCNAQNNGDDGFESSGQNNSLVGNFSARNTGLNYDLDYNVRQSFVGNNIEFGPAINAGGEVALGDRVVQSVGNTGGNTFTEKEVYQMNNLSGGSIVEGDLVIYTTVGDSFTTTTTAGDDKVMGMAMGTISAGNYGPILKAGYTTKLKVNGTTDIAVGDWIGTHTVAGVGAKVTSGTAIAIALEAYTTNDSNGVIDALLITPRKVGSGLPTGSIIMWSGTIANIPDGFLICDGNNGTPNLLARFVQGVATAATNPGSTGGATAKSGTTDIEVATPIKEGGGSSNAAADDHTHAFSISDIRPLYYDVAFIMKS